MRRWHGPEPAEICSPTSSVEALLSVFLSFFIHFIIYFPLFFHSSFSSLSLTYFVPQSKEERSEEESKGVERREGEKERIYWVDPSQPHGEARETPFPRLPFSATQMAKH